MTSACTTWRPAANHSTYNTLYVAFAVAMGVRGVVVANGPFLDRHVAPPDPTLAVMFIPISE